MDVCSLVGHELGLQVLALASAVLDTPNIRPYFSEPHRIISQLNGQVKDPTAFAQPRYSGFDIQRLLRAPILRLAADDDNLPSFEAVFMSVLIALHGGKHKFTSYSPEHPCCLVIFKNTEHYTDAIIDHATNSIPAPLFSASNKRWVRYFSPVQMFTFLVLLIFTKKSRDAFVHEAALELYNGCGSWMDKNTILTSLRVSLLPFMQWIQVRGDPKLFKEGERKLRPSELSYLPTVEDGCLLVRASKLPEIGKIFSSLVPMELVNWVVHQKDRGYFAGHNSFWSWHSAPRITARPVDLMTVAFYYFYQLSLRAIEASSILSDFRLQSFPQFIHLVVSVLSRPDWITSVKFHPAIKEHLETMRESLARGKIGGDRFLLAMMQIAVVFREREPTAPAPVHRAVWDYTSIQTFSAAHSPLLRPHCSPQPPLGDFGAILVRNCRADVLRSLASPMLEGAAQHDLYDLRLHFVDFVHADYTNSEVATLVIVPEDSMKVALQALQICMYQSTMLANPESREMGVDKTQMLVGFLGSLLSGGPLLFHWLNVFPRMLVPPKPKPVKQKPVIDMELASSSDDDDDDEEDQERCDRDAVLHHVIPVSCEVKQRIEILCKPGFVSVLLGQAIKEDADELQKLQESANNRSKPGSVPMLVTNDHDFFKKTLTAIMMSCSDRICTDLDGLRNLAHLNPKFYDDALFFSDVFKSWSVMRRADVNEHIKTKPRGWFPDDSAIRFEKKRESLFDIDNKLALWIMRDIASDLSCDRTASAGLRKFVQLHPCSRLTATQFDVFFRWIDGAPTAVNLALRDVHTEFVNAATAGHMHPLPERESNARDEEVVTVFGNVCGLQFHDIPVSSIASCRLLINGRTSAEILRPVNQVNIFRTDLARIGSQLVQELMFEDHPIVDGLLFSTPLVKEAAKSKSRGEQFLKEKKNNKRTKLDHPQGAAAAASAAPHRASAVAASSIPACEAYSPSRPGYDEKDVYNPPAGYGDDEWKQEVDISRVVAAQLDPVSYGGSSSSSKKRRAGHEE